MKIVCDNKIPFLRGVLEPYADVVYLAGKQTTPADVKDADAIITRTRTICNSSLLEGAKVKVIATATIGFDHIDTSWVESHGIVWRNAPGCNSWSVKQYISSVLCRLAKRHSLDLSTLTLGVVGVGNVGSKVARAAKALGMKVLLCDPPRARKEGQDGFVDLDEIVAGSDIITLHVPLSKEGPDATYHLFDAQRLSTLRPEQFLFNSSRGPVVDNVALKASLLSRSIRGAVLDVWEGEPDLDPELVRLLEFSTPHIAGYSADGKANGTTASVRTVAEILDLPLKTWKAEGIPGPEQPSTVQGLEFTLDATGKTLQQALSEAVLHTYDVKEDSDRLRANLGLFETLRGDYPVRREPSAYTIDLIGGTPELRYALSELDFKLTNK